VPSVKCVKTFDTFSGVFHPLRFGAEFPISRFQSPLKYRATVTTCNPFFPSMMFCRSVLETIQKAIFCIWNFKKNFWRWYLGPSCGRGRHLPAPTPKHGLYAPSHARCSNL